MSSPNPHSSVQVLIKLSWFGENMIILAYQITLDNKGSLNFNYTNKILENWKNAGVYTTDDAKRSSEEFRGKRRRKPEESGNSSIDMDDVMDELRRQYQ